MIYTICRHAPCYRSHDVCQPIQPVARARIEEVLLQYLYHPAIHHRHYQRYQPQFPPLLPVAQHIPHQRSPQAQIHQHVRPLVRTLHRRQLEMRLTYQAAIQYDSRHHRTFPIAQCTSYSQTYLFHCLCVNQIAFSPAEFCRLFVAIRCSRPLEHLHYNVLIYNLVPKHKSPASPKPGTIYFFSFNSGSIAAHQRVACSGIVAFRYSMACFVPIVQARCTCFGVP